MRAAVALTLLSASGVVCAGDAVKHGRTWFGTIKEPELRKFAPADRFIVDASSFAKVWKAWKPIDEIPAFDFAGNILVVWTEDEGKIDRFVLRLDKKGDLAVGLGFSVKEKLPGFSFGMAEVSRSGVVSVAGRKLK